MPESADVQFQRLLFTFAAAQGDGISLRYLAEKLDTDPSQILDDLREVTAREFYHTAGSGDSIQVTIERDRVSVFTGKEFGRPIRLGPREAIALGLGLRSLAAERTGAERERILTLASRLEHQLAGAPEEAGRARIEVSSGEGSLDGIRMALADAARHQTAVVIRYLKPGETEAEDREVEPYVLGYAKNTWYLMGHCHRAGAVRVFRVDRILEAHDVERTFRVPDDFDPAEYLADGRIYRADTEVVATVRYSSSVAAWVREHEEVEDGPSGSVIVRHHVADPGWLIRHVLRFGSEAEVLDPPDLREMVRLAATDILTTGRIEASLEPA